MSSLVERQPVADGGRLPEAGGHAATPAAYQAPARLDQFGAAASLVCAVHCALLPLLVTLLPLVGLQFLADDWVEWLLVGLSAAFGVTSLCLGYREHRSRRAFALLGAGLALLALGRILEERDLGRWGVPALVLGGVTMAGAHVLNRRLCRSCRSCRP